MDILVEAAGGGGGLAPVGLLTRLLRRSARYAARSWSIPITSTAEAELVAQTYQTGRWTCRTETAA